MMDAFIQQRIDEWLSGPYDEESKKTIRTLQKTNPEALVDAFYTDLSFGTAGLRGIMGVGTNRMNVYTVQKATQGLANYLLKQQKNPSVVIGYDCRNNSLLFAEKTAEVLAGNGIKVFLYKDMRPVPYVSFGVRNLHTTAGVMITASHNPAEYNGYKVFWSDGAQVVPPHDQGIIEDVRAITSLGQIRHAPGSPLIERLEIDAAYLKALRALQYQPADNQAYGKLLKITYTPLHGTGMTLVPKALLEWGFPQVNCVAKQMIPDGNFPTVKFPNPEYKEALQLGMDQMLETQSDILLATDPDADRMGVVVRHQGKPEILTGNEIAAIFANYLCQRHPTPAAIVTSIVSTDLLKVIAGHYKKSCVEVLTGFKYIGEKIHEWENSPTGYAFLFGAEESYGFLIGTYARDKDAVSASCLMAEIALDAKRKQKTLVDILHDIYRALGLYRERQHSIMFKPGKEGTEEMKNLMKKLRAHLPQAESIEDYAHGFNGLPPADVLLFRLKGGSKIVIRPSGTEPKIKVYLSTHEIHFTSIEAGIAACEKKLDDLLKQVQSWLH